jgi:hypothetical protein
MKSKVWNLRLTNDDTANPFDVVREQVVYVNFMTRTQPSGKRFAVDNSFAQPAGQFALPMNRFPPNGVLRCNCHRPFSRSIQRDKSCLTRKYVSHFTEANIPWNAVSKRKFAICHIQSTTISFCEEPLRLFELAQWRKSISVENAIKRLQRPEAIG